MILGANPSTSAPHVHQYWLPETHVTKIVVDSIRHETAAAANIHLQLHPGTDGALAFAMLRAIWAAGRIDQTFFAARAQDWEEIEKQLGAEGRYPGLQEPLDRQRHQEQRQRARAARRTSRRESCAVHSINVSLVPA
jgi:anaerobic selenocysteine-containing dehydrogenase